MKSLAARIKNNPMIYLTAKLWQYSKGNRYKVVLYFALFSAANAIGLLEPLVIGKALNLIQEQGINRENIRHLLLLLSLLPLLSLAFWLLFGPARVIENRNAFLVRTNCRTRLLEGVMGLQLEWHADHHSGNTIDRIEKGTIALYSYSRDSFRVIDAIVRLVGSLAALIRFDLGAGCIALVAIAFTLALIIKFDRVLVRQYKQLLKIENRISERVFDVLSNVNTVIMLRIEKLLLGSLSRTMMEPLDLYNRNCRINELKWCLVSLSGSIMTILVLASYLYARVEAGEPIMAGTVYALYGYVQRVAGLFFTFTGMYGAFVQQKAAVASAEELAEQFKGVERPLSGAYLSGWRELKVDSLAFSYHSADGTDLHLDDISFSITRGEKVALVGESGSGKTTLLKIMRGLYRPGRANVYLDGVLLADGFQSVSSEITLIPQEPEIFSTTILENITLGVGYEMSYVKKFSDMACFNSVAEQLPKKFDSLVFEKGVNLSGGRETAVGTGERSSGLPGQIDRPAR